MRAMRPPRPDSLRRPAGLYTGFGDIVTTTTPTAQVTSMLGGAGVSDWVQLFNPGHLAGAWDGPIEHLRLPPGASCGKHHHRDREEFYYITSGSARMHVNGATRPVTAGTLITCPIDTNHGISVPLVAPGPMTFLVVELYPGRIRVPGQEVQYIPVRDSLRPAAGWGGYEGDDLKIAQVDLSRHMTGPWGHFTEIKIPPEETVSLGRPRTAGTAEFLLILDGQAEITHGDAVDKGGAGLVIASVADVTARNTSDRDPLHLITVGVSA